MKRRETVAEFPCNSGLGDHEVCGTIKVIWSVSSSHNAKSSIFYPSYRRSRTLSQFSVSSQSSKLTLDLFKMPPTSTLWSYNASGCFSPTTSASASLLALDPSFSRESPYFQRKHLPAPSLWDGDGTESPTPQSPETSSLNPPSSPLSMKSSLSSIPAISRTSSSFSDLDILMTASPGPPPLNANGRCNKEIHPILAACEKMSKVSSRAVCATCMKPGNNYPRCAKCGEMWCSRTCRLRDGGKRHICSQTNI
jgi:hypothetical protein